MEPDVSIESMCTIRVAVVPIGGIPRSLFREYASLLSSHSRIDLSFIISFYTEHQKSPFAQQPWGSGGALRFRFIPGGSLPPPGRISSPIARSFLSSEFSTALPRPISMSSLTTSPASVRDTVRLSFSAVFGFCPGDDQLGDGNRKEGNVVLFPPADRPTLEMHMSTMMQDIVASLLMEFEKWALRAESAGTIVKTPLDSQASLSSEEFYGLGVMLDCQCIICNCFLFSSNF